MRILTRSRRIRRALRIVRERIPPKDWQAATSFLKSVQAQSDWEAIGLMSGVNKAGGRLLPLYELAVPIREQKNPRGQILFSLPVCRLYSDKALVGLAAHELAHAVRAARHGPGWWEKMDCNYPAEERIADTMASRWGFRSHIRAMRREQKTIVVPLLDYREPQIMRLLHRRAHEEYEREKKTFLRGGR